MPEFYQILRKDNVQSGIPGRQLADRTGSSAGGDRVCLSVDGLLSPARSGRRASRLDCSGNGRTRRLVDAAFSGRAVFRQADTLFLVPSLIVAIVRHERSGPAPAGLDIRPAGGDHYRPGRLAIVSAERPVGWRAFFTAR